MEKASYIQLSYVTMFHPLSRCRPSRWASDSLQLGAENAAIAEVGNFLRIWNIQSM